MQIDVVRRDVDLAGDGARLLDVLGGDGRLAIGQAVGAAVVHALDVGTGDGEEHAADFHIAGVLRLGERVLEAGAGLGEIIDLALADAGGFGHADAQDLDGAVRLHLTDDNAGLAGADLESDVNFGATCHEGWDCEKKSVAVEKGFQIAGAAVFPDFLEGLARPREWRGGPAIRCAG